MKLIIPMAGLGKRMRPHTLTTPKPLIPVAGKPMVHVLVEEISKTVNQKIDEIAFIIGRFGEETEKNLLQIAANLGAKGSIYYQDVPLGTAHAIYCAEPSLSGNVIVAFADTLFKADIHIDTEADSVIWVKQVANPESFGVVKVNERNEITEFIEKPKQFITDLAIIGIYYFKDGENLKTELKFLLDTDFRVNGEYQLTDALQNMKNKNKLFKTATVTEWLDCGNKDATLYTNSRILYHQKTQISQKVIIENSVIIDPVFVAEGCRISNTVLGPNVSISENATIDKSVLSNSIIRINAKISNSNICDSIIGEFASITSQSTILNLSDYSETTL